MTASLDSSQKQPRIVSEEWLAATESEYQETARQVGEILSEIRNTPQGHYGYSPFLWRLWA